jgi:Raf kinase inhibitor-like YbhB/YbcL family protein
MEISGIDAVAVNMSAGPVPARAIVRLAVWGVALWAAATFAVACSASEATPAPTAEGEATLSVTSPAFRDEDRVPLKHTCEGEDVSPALQWGQPPDGAQSLALVVDDPDAPRGIFTHWVVFNLPTGSRGLPEAASNGGQVPAGALQGKNDFGRAGYGGPGPPPGPTHHYRFTLYALDITLDLTPGANVGQVSGAMEGHILARGLLTGIYRQ